MTIEYRSVSSAEVSDGKLTGLVTPFGVETTIGDLKRGGFTEEIGPGAFKKTLQEQDVVLIHNHDTSMPMARMSVPAGTEGSLTLTPVADEGLRCKAIPVDTSYARDVQRLADRGILGMSFGFEVTKDRWFDNEGRASNSVQGTKRIVDEVKLHEVTTTAFPAYGTTLGTVSARDAVAAARELRAPKATYADVETCGECGSTNQFGAYCSGCGSSMSSSGAQAGNFCTSCGGELDDSRGAHECYDIRDSKPYGDVAYADEKNGKYPIDTKTHAKAAWAYINMPKNAAEYPLNGVTLASVKNKIKAALIKFGVTISEDHSLIDPEETRDAAAMDDADADKLHGLLAGIDASLDEAMKQFCDPSVDRNSLPAAVNQGIDLVKSACGNIGEVLSVKGIPDPDKPNGNDYDDAGRSVDVETAKRAVIAADLMQRMYSI